MVQEQEQEKEQQREKQVAPLPPSQHLPQKIDTRIFQEPTGEDRPWPLILLSAKEAGGSDGGGPFYPLSLFKASSSPESPTLPFPSSMWISQNHTFFYVPPNRLRRLKDVHVVVITASPESGMRPESVIVTLREAEAVRFAVHTGQDSSRSIGVLTPHGTWLTTPPHQLELEAHSSTNLLLARFFNSEMRFRDDEEVNEIIPLVTQLARFALPSNSPLTRFSAPAKVRETFFSEVARCRRRHLHGWDTSTLVQLFLYENDLVLRKFRGVSDLVRAKLKEVEGKPPTFKGFLFQDTLHSSPISKRLTATRMVSSTTPTSPTYSKVNCK